MRKVLLVPLLILIPLSGMQALSSKGETPGATVLHGQLGTWAVEAVEAQSQLREIEEADLLYDVLLLPDVDQLATRELVADVSPSMSQPARNGGGASGED